MHGRKGNKKMIEKEYHDGSKITIAMYIHHWNTPIVHYTMRNIEQLNAVSI